MSPMRVIDFILVIALLVGILLAHEAFTKIKRYPDCPIQNGHSHVYSEYRTDGTLICSYQQIQTGRVILRRQA